MTRIYNKYTKEILEPVIKESKTWTDVCRKMKVVPITGAQTYIKSRAVKFKINFSHFLGRSIGRGKLPQNKKPIDYFLQKNGPHIKSHALRLRLIKENLKVAKCELCGMNKWFGQPIPLELNHINKDHFDNRLVNLQILCPNCHASYHAGVAE